MPQTVIVTASARELRSLGRWALNGTWGKCVLAMLLSYIVINVPQLVLLAVFGFNGNLTDVLNVYTTLVTPPLALGTSMFFLNVFRRRPAEPIELFYGFEFILKAVLLEIAMALLIFFQTLLFIIPGLIATFRYSMAFYILADDPRKGVMQCIRESKYLMMGNKASLFFVSFSFFGWYLLCSILPGMVIAFYPEWQLQTMNFEIISLLSNVGFLFLMPYVLLTTCAFYEIANGNLRIKRASRYDGPNGGGKDNWNANQNPGGRDFDGSGSHVSQGGGTTEDGTKIVDAEIVGQMEDAPVIVDAEVVDADEEDAPPRV